MLQKGYNRLEKDLIKCRSMLSDKTKEVILLTQRLKSKEAAEEVRSGKLEEPEIVEEAVQTAGDYKNVNAVGSR